MNNKLDFAVPSPRKRKSSTWSAPDAKDDGDDDNRLSYHTLIDDDKEIGDDVDTDNNDDVDGDDGKDDDGDE